MITLGKSSIQMELFCSASKGGRPRASVIDELRSRDTRSALKGQRRNYSEITTRKYLQYVTAFARHFGKFRISWGRMN